MSVHARLGKVIPMPSIHIVKNDPNLPDLRPIAPGSDIYESGYWSLAAATAASLVGGQVFFHQKQSEPSYFGGIIQNMRTSDEHPGRFVITFQSIASCRGLRTSRAGWSQEMKLVQ